MKRRRIRNWADEIRCARLAAGLRQEHLAAVLKRSQPWLARVESGDIPIGDGAGEHILKAIERLCEVAKSGAADVDFRDLALPLRIGDAY